MCINYCFACAVNVMDFRLSPSCDRVGFQFVDNAQFFEPLLASPYTHGSALRGPGVVFLAPHTPCTPSCTLRPSPRGVLPLVGCGEDLLP